MTDRLRNTGQAAAIRAKSPIRRLVASAITVLVLLGASSAAHALSCAPRRFTLSEAYETADSIIVGQVTECKEATSSDVWTSGGSGCSYSSIEVLKESIPARDYSGEASSTACGLSLQVGDRYLLYLDQNNQPLHFSEPLDGDRYPAERGNRYLQILRDFRSGAADDLAEPWNFAEFHGQCSVSHQVGNIGIRFDRRSSSAPPLPMPEWTQDTIDGSQVYRARSPAFDLDTQMPTGELEMVAFGDVPDYSDDALILTVNFQEMPPVPVRQATFATKDRSWPLIAMQLHWSVPGSAVVSVASYQAAEEVAEQILGAIEQPTDFVVTATLVESTDVPESDPEPPPDQGATVRIAPGDSYFGPGPVESSSANRAGIPNARNSNPYNVRTQAPEPVLRLESRSTQLSSVMKLFRACNPNEQQ